jgi:hypothetical protein
VDTAVERKVEGSSHRPSDPLYGPVIKFSDGYQNKRLVIKKNENTDSYQKKTDGYQKI